MNYQEFKTMLKDRMQEIMGDSIEVTYETYTKNSQTKIEAMIFKEKEPQAGTLLSPSIHLQDLYELYEENGDSKEFDDCLHQIKVLYQNQEPKNLKRMDIYRIVANLSEETLSVVDLETKRRTWVKYIDCYEKIFNIDIHDTISIPDGIMCACFIAFLYKRFI